MSKDIDPANEKRATSTIWKGQGPIIWTKFLGHMYQDLRL